MYYDLLVLNLRSGVYFFYFFTFFLLWLKREKNSGWYIHLTSHQLPPNLHNVTSAWPVMLLANQRLRHGNQILAGIMSLSKSILGKRKFLSTFLKKNLNVFFFFLWWNTASWSCRNIYWLCPVPKAAEKKLGWSTTFHELKSVVKAKIAQNISRVSEGGITVKPG